MSPGDWEDSQVPLDKLLEEEEMDREDNVLPQWEEDEGLEEDRPINEAGDGFQDWEPEEEKVEDQWPDDEADGSLANAGEDIWPEEQEDDGAEGDGAEAQETWADEEWDGPAEEAWEDGAITLAHAVACSNPAVLACSLHQPLQEQSPADAPNAESSKSFACNLHGTNTSSSSSSSSSSRRRRRSSSSSKST